MRIYKNLAILLSLTLWATTSLFGAELQFSNYYTDNMVLQRDKTVTITGFADKDTSVTIEFADQKKSSKTDSNGKWSVALDAMDASAKARDLKCYATGAKAAILLKNILVGDVLLFARQTYVDISLGRNEAGKKSAASHKASKTFRALLIKTIPAKKPLVDLDEQASSGWVEVDSNNALLMSASSYHFGIDLDKQLNIPIGIVDINMGHHFGIGWLSAKAIADSVIMNPKDKEISWLPEHMQKKAEERDSGKAQKDLDAYYQNRMKGKGEKPHIGLHPMKNPMYPSGGYNAVIHPLQDITFKSMLLQLGNDYPFIAYREIEKEGLSTTKAGYDTGWHHNYLILKSGYRITSKTLPYVPGDWRRTFKDKNLPIGLILPPSSSLDVYAAHNREIRELHRRTAEKAEGIGLILPGNDNIPFSGQPRDDKLLADRCSAWYLGSVAQRDGKTATGPEVLKIETRLTKATIHFKEGTAEGLKASPDSLKQFETAGADRVFTAAKATVEGSTIRLVSESPVVFVRYNWTYRPSQELTNNAGLPALPFSTDPNWIFGWIPPSETPNLPIEYKTTANKWSKSDVAIINGQIANMAAGDSEQIPRRPGPLGIVASPFGPNIIVVEIDPDTPAVGIVMPNDVIYGVNGKIFSDKEGTRSDEQYKVLADAITFSESEEGKGILVLSLRRGTELMDVKLQLKVLGSYSSTSPYYCEKSQNIAANAEAWAERRYRPESGLASEPTGKLNTDLLFLLASGSPKSQGLVRRAVYNSIEKMQLKEVKAGMRSKPWHTGYMSLLLGEYFHATGDRNVLPYLKFQADLSAESQIKPKDETPPEWEAAQGEAQVGGWRQNSHTAPDRWKSGYGLMPHAGMPCLMGMALADEAGLEIDQVALKRGLKHYRKGRAEFASVIYTYSGSWRTGPPTTNPDVEARGGLWSMNGKLGTAAALYDMVEDEGPASICARVCVYGYNNTRHGHGGMFFNNFWTPVGANIAGESGFKHFMKGQRWWRELFRKHDGSFTQAGRGGIGISYALPYVATKKRLRMLGAPKSAFGVNAPDYLKAAIKAHQKRDYAVCEKLITKQLKENITPAKDMPVVNHLFESVRILRESIAHDLDYVERMIKENKFYYASLELKQLKGVVREDHPRLLNIIKTLTTPQTSAAITNERKAYDTAKRTKQAKLKAQALKKEIWKGLLPKGSPWQMKVVENITQAPTHWTNSDFDDSAWNTAKVPISWTMYHTALFRGQFKITDLSKFDGLRIRGQFFQQANVVVHLNGELVAKIDDIGRGGGYTIAQLTDAAMKLLKEGDNTIAISSRHKRRWGSYRGTYVSAATVSFSAEARLKD